MVGDDRCRHGRARYRSTTVRTLLRLALVVVIAGLGLTGVVVAMMPPLARVVTSPTLRAGVLPPLSTLSAASVVFDVDKNPIDRLNVENIQPFTLAQVPKDVISADRKSVV